MADARFVRIEGIQSPCLLISHDGHVPEELVVDFVDGAEHGAVGESTGGRRHVVYRLQPSSVQGKQPVYVEVFDE